MKEFFKETNFTPKRREMIDLCNTIINNYLDQGLRLTLRQLYYQLVIRNVIPNREQSYKQVGNLLSDARLAGLVDWDAIEDRVRVPRRPQEFKNLDELVRAALYSYRLPRWDGQDYYIELWVEKDALSGVLAPLAREFHITLMVNRGYSSQSAMYEAANRFIANSNGSGVLLYLGDHDPSGEDMVRDIRDRLEMMNAQVEVEKIALTMAQVEEYNPPPNPAKLSDSRAAGYIDKHGDSSWEVDALPPEVLQQLIREKVEEYLDHGLMDLVIKREERDKALLTAFVSGLSSEKEKERNDDDE
jgi:hypothetical protein